MASTGFQLRYLKKRLEWTLAGRGRTRRRKRKRPTRHKNVLTDLVGASGAALNVLVDDARLLVENALNQTKDGLDAVIENRAWTSQVWLPSFISLGAVDVALSSSRLARSFKGLEFVGGVAGLGLIAASSLDLWNAETPEQKLDAGSDLMWGAQGTSYVIASSSVATLATGLGIVGAALQVSSGVLRISNGIRDRDPATIKLGALDLGGGILWAGWDVAGWANPAFLASYVVLMVGREAYANREAVQRWLAERGLVAEPSTA